MRNWVEWHQNYESPGSSLSRRLEVVRTRLNEALEAVRPEPVILSLCAGDGRDVIAVLKGQPAKVGRAVLIELDQTLTDRARQAAETARLTAVEVRCRDAAKVDSFIDVLPVDVLMLCGIFGNIDHTRVKNVVDLIPCLIEEGGFVIWTRGGSEPDRRPEVRRWFTEAGLEEVTFDGAPQPYGVGLSRMKRPGVPKEALPRLLFSFQYASRAVNTS